MHNLLKPNCEAFSPVGTLGPKLRLVSLPVHIIHLRLRLHRGRLKSGIQSWTASLLDSRCWKRAVNLLTFSIWHCLRERGWQEELVALWHRPSGWALTVLFALLVRPGDNRLWGPVTTICPMHLTKLCQPFARCGTIDHLWQSVHAIRHRSDGWGERGLHPLQLCN